VGTAVVRAQSSRRYCGGGDKRIESQVTGEMEKVQWWRHGQGLKEEIGKEITK
jgi:hypothetical protein